MAKVTGRADIGILHQIFVAVDVVQTSTFDIRKETAGRRPKSNGY